jgi:thioredoxin 1
MNIMAVRAIENEADFTLHVSHSKGVVLVAFWAPWCEPCKMIRSEIKRAAQSFTGRTEVFKVDVDELHSIAEKYEIMAVPTLLFFKNGHPVKRIIGYAAQEEIEKMFQSVLAT